MKRIYTYGNRNVSSQSNGSFIVGFGNSYFASTSNQSRFDGLFINGFKTIHNIGLGIKPDSIETNFISTIRNTNYSTEQFTLSKFGLLYEIENCDKELVLDLDFRFEKELDTNGRIYKIKEKKDMIIIEFKKYSDDSLKHEQYTKFLAVKGIIDYNLKQDWIKIENDYDRERNSRPFEQWIFRALTFHVHGNKDIIFCAADSEFEAERKIEEFYSNIKHFKSAVRNYKAKLLHNNLHFTDPILDFAFKQSIVNLDSLTINNNKPIILAGLPWFNQEWRRDEALATRGHYCLGNENITKNLLLKYTNGIGKLSTKPLDPTKSCDARLIAYSNILKILKEKPLFFSRQELELIFENSKENLLDILEFQTENNLYYNEDGETWMDSISRKGKNIEMQALLLSNIELVRLLGEKFNHEYTQKYAKLLKLTREKILKEFFVDGKLVDNLENPVITCNIFLAWYYYPKLLSKKEWEVVFDNALQELWLSWGGVSSLSKNDPAFVGIHTGQDSTSYHKGDSWYFINNITAMALKNVNHKKYKYNINRIIHSSCYSSLFQGHTSSPEVSSAIECNAEGSWMQVWTASTFIELMYLMKK